MTNSNHDAGYLSSTDLEKFKNIGRNCAISENSSFYGAENISIGSNVRIDDFVVITAVGGFINIGDYVHIASHSYLNAAGGIEMSDYSGISHGVRVYSSSDDYSGESLTNPTIPIQFRNVKKKLVRLGRHVIIGSNSVILPGVEIGEGAAIGAMTLVHKSLESWNIYSGIPARKIKQRDKKLLELEIEFKNSN